MVADRNYRRDRAEMATTPTLGKQKTAISSFPLPNSPLHFMGDNLDRKRVLCRLGFVLATRNLDFCTPRIRIRNSQLSHFIRLTTSLGLD